MLKKTVCVLILIFSLNIQSASMDVDSSKAVALYKLQNIVSEYFGTTTSPADDLSAIVKEAFNPKGYREIVLQNIDLIQDRMTKNGEKPSSCESLSLALYVATRKKGNAFLWFEGIETIMEGCEEAFEFLNKYFKAHKVLSELS